MKIIEGDLIEAALNGKFDVIAHGCNCYHTMGAGIAKQIKKVFPGAYKADCETPYGDPNKLGTFSKLSVIQLTILNCYTQFHFGFNNGEPPVDYKAIRSCMELIKLYYTGYRIGLPMIGCGLAGGSWDIVKQIIEQELMDEDVTIMFL